jgi:hypothetical protein
MNQTPILPPIQTRSSEPVLLNRKRVIAYLNIYKENNCETLNDDDQ